MEYAELFNSISLGVAISWTLAFLFIGGLMYKGLEKYHKYKKDTEKKKEILNTHEEQINKIDNEVKEIGKKVDSIIVTLDKSMENADMREARRLRREILKFGDNIRMGKTYSKDAYQDIIESNEEYENIIAKRQIKNGFTEHEMKFIVNKYDELYGGLS